MKYCLDCEYGIDFYQSLALDCYPKSQILRQLGSNQRHLDCWR